MFKAKIAAACLAAIVATEAHGQSFSAITDRTEFLSTLAGRDLRLSTYGLTLTVTADGRIEGRAIGAPVTGNWSWQGGYFCREMQWGGTEIPYNCQLVESAAPNRMRFTVDQGAGQSATFTLR